MLHYILSFTPRRLSGRQRRRDTIAWQQDDNAVARDNFKRTGVGGVMYLVLWPPHLWSSPDVLIPQDLICWVTIAILELISFWAEGGDPFPVSCTPAVFMYQMAIVMQASEGMASCRVYHQIELDPGARFPVPWLSLQSHANSQI